MPTFRFPFFYNPNYYNRFRPSPQYFPKGDGAAHANYCANNKPACNNVSSVNNQCSDITNVSPTKPDINKCSSQDVKNNSSSNDDDYFFELFGLKLYFDDVLLICLIFFLYEEGVQDQELFLSLILLLLS